MKRGKVTAFAGLCALILSVASFGQAENGPYAVLLHSDLVIRAKCITARNDLVPAKQFDSRNPANLEGTFVQINRASFLVQEVLKGNYEKQELEVVSHESVSMNGFVGHELVLAIDFSETLLGGSYFYRGDDVFIWQDGGWGKGGVRHEDVDLRAAIAAVQIENLARASDVIAVGVVESLRERRWRSETGETALFQEIVLRVKEVQKGSDLPGTVRIRSIIKGTYWPAWRSPMPLKTRVNDMLYTFLRRDGDEYYVLGGVNGCFKVTEKGLIYNDHVVLSFSKGELDSRVKRIERSDAGE